MAAVALAAAAAILAVRPSGPTVPANLLRISVVFDHPAVGPALPSLELVDAAGRPIPAPFLEQELWSPDGRVLTLLLHPGRVKSGLLAHDLDGPVLTPGEVVTLRRNGDLLKRWTVGPARLQAVNPARWRLGPPPAQSRRPLVVALDAPIDAMDANLVALEGAEGRRVAGVAGLTHGEAAWRFTPARPWSAGAYRLVVHPELEDPAGNRVAQAFEHASGPDPAPAAALSFIIR